jgi:hypothetical protein
LPTAIALEQLTNILARQRPRALNLLRASPRLEAHLLTSSKLSRWSLYADRSRKALRRPIWSVVEQEPVRHVGEDGHARPLGLRGRVVRPHRLDDGRWNDPNDPGMGSRGSAFTRYINPKRIKPEKPPRLFDPNPREVSLELMTRD